MGREQLDSPHTPSPPAWQVPVPTATRGWKALDTDRVGASWGPRGEAQLGRTPPPAHQARQPGLSLARAGQQPFPLSAAVFTCRRHRVRWERGRVARTIVSFSPRLTTWFSESRPQGAWRGWVVLATSVSLTQTLLPSASAWRSRGRWRSPGHPQRGAAGGPRVPCSWRPIHPLGDLRDLLCLVTGRLARNICH